MQIFTNQHYLVLVLEPANGFEDAKCDIGLAVAMISQSGFAFRIEILVCPISRMRLKNLQEHLHLYGTQNGSEMISIKTSE